MWEKKNLRENRVSSANTEGNPFRNTLVRAKSEPDDLNAHKT